MAIELSRNTLALQTCFLQIPISSPSQPSKSKELSSKPFGRKREELKVSNILFSSYSFLLIILSGEILLYSKNLILFKPSLDLIFYVVGPEGENELMLNSLLSAFYDSVSLLLRHQVEKRAVLENLDMVVLALDECVDDGSV
jgi:hypothetical protein